MARKKEMVTNIVTDEAPIAPEDMGSEPIATESVEETKEEVKVVISDIKVGDDVLINQSSFKALIGRIGKVSEVTEGGNLIVEVDKDLYCFLPESVRKV